MFHRHSSCQRRRVVGWRLIAAVLLVASGTEVRGQQEFFDALSRTCTGAAREQLLARQCQTCHTANPGREGSGNANTAIAQVFRSSGRSPAAACAALTPVATGPNRAPVLAELPAGVTLRAGKRFSLTLTARDADAGSRVRFSVAGADGSPKPAKAKLRNLPPRGSKFAAVFTWKPKASQAGQDFVLRFRAADNGRPPLAAVQSVEFKVIP